MTVLQLLYLFLGFCILSYKVGKSIDSACSDYLPFQELPQCQILDAGQ